MEIWIKKDLRDGYMYWTVSNFEKWGIDGKDHGVWLVSKPFCGILSLNYVRNFTGGTETTRRAQQSVVNDEQRWCIFDTCMNIDQIPINWEKQIN